MLQKTSTTIASLLLIAVAFFSSCKKDPFSEKDALAAQQSLLQLQFSYQLQITQINAAASRSHDSALIAIQNLVNSGASSLAVLQAQQQMAALMQQYQNQINLYKMQDSLSRATSRFNDSLYAARNNQNMLNALKKNYIVKVNDASTNAPVAGATASVFSYTSNSTMTATTDGNGVANFTQVIVDPNAYFYISNANYATALIQASAVLQSNTIVSLWNSGNAQNTVKGQILADLDLTNGSTVEGVAGQLVTFNLNYGAQTNQFPTVTDANGNYSIKLPDAPNGYAYFVNTSNQITISQRMFVRYLNGIDDPFKVLPHIDSVNTTLSLGSSYQQWSYAKTTWTPFYPVPSLSSAFYLKLPNDSLGNQIFIPLLRTINNYTNWFMLSQQNNPTFTAPWSIEADSLRGIWYNNGTTWQFNTVGGINNSGFGQYNNVSSTDFRYSYKLKDTVVNATMVDLTGRIMTATPTVSVHIAATGKIQNIVSANGGLFSVYDWNGREITGNSFGYRDDQFKKNVYNGSGLILNGGVTKTINFDYINLNSREKNPQ